VPGNTVKSQVVAFAQKSLQADGQISSKLHVIELGAQAGLGLPPTARLGLPPSAWCLAVCSQCTCT
jgi:hypothetical protein